MKKHLCYLKRIYHLSKMRMHAYPLNHTIGSLTRSMYFLTGVLLLFFSFRLLPPPHLLYGASFADCLIAFLLFQICFYTLNSIHFNTYDFQKQVLQGNLDHKILLPLPGYLSIMTQEFYVQSMKDSILGIFLLFCLMFWMGLSLQKILLLLFILFSSYVILGSMNLLLNAMGFHFEGFMRSPNWLQDQLSQLSRYPKSIYPLLLEYLLFPFFFVINPAFSILRGTFTAQDILLQSIFTASILSMGIIVWKHGFKKYNSGN